MTKWLALFGIALAWILPPAAGAATLAISGVQGDWGLEGNDGATRGWGFTPNSDIRVESLGVLDWEADGLINSHKVGIWDDEMNLLASVVVQAGIDSAAVGGIVNDTFVESVFRFEAIAPQVLLAGEQYFIGAQYFIGGDRVVLFSDPTTVDAAIDLGPIGRAHFNEFGFPDWEFPSDSDGYFGPNFTFVVVPEPGSGWLVAGGLVGWTLALGRRSDRRIS